MQYLILGPLEVRAEAGNVAIPAAKQRALLAILLVRHGSPVPGWRLIEELWPDPPVSARKVVQTYVSKLRHILPAGTLVTTQTGYRLEVGPEELDSARFEALFRAAESAPPDKQGELLREALDLWRGGALEDFVDEPFARAEITRLEAIRGAALERRFDFDLAQGRHVSLLAELGPLVQANPLNERIRGQLMLALYRSGRQDDALRVFREARRALVEQLGVEPTPALRRLEEAILRHDSDLLVPWNALSDVAAGHATTATTHGSPPQVGAGAGRRSTTRRAFVGRAGDVDRLRGLLTGARSRWVTLTGPAGSGKTRLAVEVATQVGHGYRDGWAFVDLTRIDTADQVALETAAALGIHLEDLDDAETALGDVLRPRQQLLLIDNFEHVVAAAPLIARLLDRAPDVAVMLTSRSAVGGRGEREYPVAPLSVPRADARWDTVAEADAVALFMDRARAVRPDFTLTETNAQQVAQLCTRLDGLPLAIELAAARVDLLSPRSVLARLDQRLDLFATDLPETPERHRSLRAAVDWSYELLDADSRRAFAELAVFSGGFTVDCAEAVLSHPRRLLVDTVKTLVNSSLLKPVGAAGDEPRFAMLETIREYAGMRLTETGRSDSIRARHAQSYRAMAEEAEPQLRGPDQMRWVELLYAELPNIRDAVQWGKDQDDPEMALLTVAALWRFWQVRGLTHEARAHLEDLLTHPHLSDTARAAGHLGTARCVFHQGDLDAVTLHVGACLPYYQAAGDLYSAGFAAILLGAATGRAGDADTGAGILREALTVARSIGDDWLQAMGLGYLGMVLSAQRQHQRARSALEEGLRAARELADTRMVGWFLIGLGRTALAAGDPSLAQGRFEEALTLARRLGDAWSQAWALQGLATTALAEGNVSVALTSAIDSVGLARDVHNRPATAAAVRIIATIAHDAGHDPLAATLIGAASVVHSGAPHPWTFDVDGVARLEAATLANAVGNDAMRSHRARGRALTIEEALTLATATLAN